MWLFFAIFLTRDISSALYVPGTPGAVWSQDEVRIVREKVKEMIVFEHWRGGGVFQTDGTFSTDGSTPFSNEAKYCEDCPYQKTDSSGMQVPTGAKLLRLSFHDCVPYIDADGNISGGCDGCLNWHGMGAGYTHDGKNAGEGKNYQVVYKGDNNGLQTTAAALEMIYTKVSWPSTAPALEKSLWETGKSRADLWQFAAMVALEVEIERANFACDYSYNTGNQVRLLESEEKCFFKLFEPSKFKFGRVDCIPDKSKKTTAFPYEATDTESHPNPYGSAKHVIDYLKDNFQLSAKDGISLMAVHATYGQQHNFRIPVQYQWVGAPYLTNMYFKYLAGTGMYSRRSFGLGKDMNLPFSVGDSKGKPRMGNLFTMGARKLWRSNQTENGWAGPVTWRPTNSGCNRPDEEVSKGCFDHFDENGSIVLKSGKKDRNNLCQNVTFDSNRIQYGGVPIKNTGTQACKSEKTFALTYEVNFNIEFEVDELNLPHGCNGSLDKMLWNRERGDSTVNCPPNMQKVENGETVNEITQAFGKDHDIWNRVFMSAWDKMVVNGYKEDELVEGPEYSWLGYSHVKGSYDDVSFPFVFTNNKKLNPYYKTFSNAKLRDLCIVKNKYTERFKFQNQCPPEFRRDHEDYYISVLENPLGCSDDEGCTLDSIAIHIKNVKTGNMLQLNEDSENMEVGNPNDSEYQKWTYKPTSKNEVVLKNMATSSETNWVYNNAEKTLWNQNGFAKDSVRGLEWRSEIAYEVGTKIPKESFQWEISRA